MRRRIGLAALLALAASHTHADEKPPAPATEVQAGGEAGFTPAESPGVWGVRRSSPQLKDADKDGFVLQSEDGAYKLKVGGYLQADGRFYLEDADKAGTDTFILRRVRPILQGTVAKYFDFYVNTDFGGGTVVLQDAYLDAHYSPKLRVRAGKFKPPVGLERLASGQALLFVERALPTALVPNRDVGVQLHGELAGGVLTYAGGLFNGVLDGGSADSDTNDGKDLAGRVLLRPFNRGRGLAFKNLGLGLAATTGKQAGGLPTYKSGGQLSFFAYATGVTAAGTRTRLSPQAAWSYKRVGLFGEWVRSAQDLRKSATSPVVRVGHRAWQAALAIVLTGEDAAPGALRPKRVFEPGKGAGALELAARVNGFDVEERTFTLGLADRARSARKVRAWGLGLNWYLNRHVKQTVDYERTRFTGGGAAGADRKTENALFIRSQISF